MTTGRSAEVILREASTPPLSAAPANSALTQSSGLSVIQLSLREHRSIVGDRPSIRRSVDGKTSRFHVVYGKLRLERLKGLQFCGVY